MACWCFYVLANFTLELEIEHFQLHLSRSVFVCCRSERLRMWLSKLYMRVFFYLSGEQDATQIRQLIKQHEDK